MCIRIIRRPTPEEIEAIERWAVVRFIGRFLYSLEVTAFPHTDSWPGYLATGWSELWQRCVPDANRFLHEAGQLLRQSAADWQTLRARLGKLAQINQQLEAEIDQLQRDKVKIERDALQAEVERLKERNTQLLVKLVQTEERLREKDEALSRAQAAHAHDVARLEATIADLNRIIVQQQEQLNAISE